MSSNIRISRICALCSKEFEARTTVTRYCSHACASRAHKEKTRRMKVQRSNTETTVVARRPMAEIQVRDFLSVDQAVRLLGVSRWTLYRAIREGTVDAARIRRRVLLRRRDLDALFKSAPEPLLVPPRVPHWVPRAEARTATGLSDKAFYDLLRRNEVPTRREGRCVFVDQNCVLELIQLKLTHEESYQGSRPQ